MRRQLRRALGVIAVLLLAAPSAGALSMGLTWIDTDGTGVRGSDTIAVKPGDQVTLQIEFYPEGVEIAGVGMSADFDLDGMNELDLVSCTTTAFQVDPVSGAGYTPVVPCGGNPGNHFPNVESELGLAGEVNQLVVVTFPETFQSSGTIVIGEMTFRVNQPLTDGADIFVGSLRQGLDGVIVGSGEYLLAPSVVLGTASVIVNPEPSTAALFGLGLIGLGAARRRSRRVTAPPAKPGASR